MAGIEAAGTVIAGLCMGHLLEVDPVGLDIAAARQENVETAAGRRAHQEDGRAEQAACSSAAASRRSPKPPARCAAATKKLSLTATGML
jgi:hypothetical protein